MLRSVNNLTGFSLEARDGGIGRVSSFLFDGRQWVIRYLVVDTGRWLPGRKVLIPPQVLDRPDWQDRIFHINQTEDRVRRSPAIDVGKPLSRRQEIELHRHYGWVPYWRTVQDRAVAREGRPPTGADRATATLTDASDESCLRSTREIVGYRIHAADGPIGHVEDFIVSDEDWIVRYLVVDTRNWLPGQSVLISPNWVRDIGWQEREVWVDVPRQAIEDSPPYDPSAPVNREYEVQMYDYYGRPKYWI